MTQPPPARPGPSAPSGLPALSAADASGLRETLLEVCSSPAWAAAVAASRPWHDREELHAANAKAMAELSAADLHDAMAGHARIGTPKPGDAVSEREQAGVRGVDPSVLDELRTANAAYEAKFGHVFLICATGRTADGMLAALRERYPNDAATEAEIVRGELRKINEIRLNQLLDERQ
ncbi:2-oxo-4-hydroxy-4-carboxy-5-ureidoimidazoline decarboxylase [Kitasatospora sp. NPDC057198]|uniref:2-oxo-4-hydroxy-4-carboxy-5-ureidoimidazoline decarboxylase n=1 Tax=Kitasatospora sp. NPDC057198 TaxID=3346046 RepID=UPI0036423945